MSLQPIVWSTPDGAISLLPDRGRVLQVQVGAHLAFWQNPNWSGDWNVGGDRLWVAPEVDWHWCTLRGVDMTQYEVPAAVDPGHWYAEAVMPGYCRVSQSVTLSHRHMASQVRLELTRHFTQVAVTPTAPLEQVVAYRTENRLLLQEGDAGQRVGLWSLIQLPGGGSMFVGSRQAPRYREHFGALTPAMWRTEDDALVLTITGRDIYKVGLAPALVTGDVVYRREISPTHYLLVWRTFFPQPWRPYCDVPMSALGTQGDAVQVYNDAGELGGFGELEYHSPAVEFGAGIDELLDTNLTVVAVLAKGAWSAWWRRKSL